MPSKSHSRRRIGSARTTKRYQKVAIGFLIVTVLLIAMIGYFSFTSTVITVTPAPVTQRVNLTVRIQETLPEETSDLAMMTGKILATTVTSSLTSDDVTPSGTVDDIARGTVTIHNTWSQTQPLQATTRLLSPDGVLFRIESRVNVPAGGKVENVKVYADQPGVGGNIGPTRFTIPGLWAGLQDQIYAQSILPMTDGTRSARTVSAENQKSLDDKLTASMRAEAENEFVKTTASGNDTLPTVDVIAEEVQEKAFSADIGVEADELMLSKTARFIAVTYDETALRQLAEQALIKNLDENFTLLGIDSDTLTLRATQYSIRDGAAELEVHAEGQAVVRLSSDIFDRQKLTAKDEQAIRDYFAGYDEILNVTVRFSPFWLRRTPTLSDHIDIRLSE